jgi:uncharacterized MAPEG superfamily protein
MSLSLWSLLGFAVWTLVLMVATIGVPRLLAIAQGRATPSAFPADQAHGSERYRRSMRAHLNCVENLPVFATLVLIGALVGVADDAFQWLALAVLPARVGQSVCHILSGSNRVVLLRFCFYVLQLTSFFSLAGLLIARGLK